MFLTHDANKHPLFSISNEGQNLWTGTEIHLRRNWFIVDFEQIDSYEDEEAVLTSTVLLSDLEHVLDLANQSLPILSVYLMTPNSLDDASCGWQMDRLVGVWEAEDPGNTGVMAKIYTTVDGHHHVESNFGTPLSQLKDWLLISTQK